jgi:hypothetical protein
MPPLASPIGIPFFSETSFKVERFLKPFYSNENQKQFVFFGHLFKI